MELYESGPSADAVRSDPDTGLEESVWMLGLGSGGDVHYPERSGEQDCAHYLRTGTCGYGGKCHFNHPRDRGAVRLTGAGRTGPVEHRERVGQHVCEYYMRTGNCKFGSTCKYHHPRQGGGSVQPVSLNFCGYPLRPGEKECTYYMKTGQCKFGSTCKFHHPQSGGASMPSPAPAFYPMMQQISVPSPQQYPPYVSWQVARPSALPGSYMAGSYAPMLLSPGVIPVQGWNPYPAPVNSVVSPADQQTVQARPIYGSQKLATSANAALPRPQTPGLSPTGPSITSHRENKLPERPGHPECQFYMRTGDCKFGATCKYHHPPYWSTPRMNVVVLNIVGLPLRPGAQPCTYYMQHGLCKFGQTCKFDHPMTTMSYSPSASSFSDMPVAPYPIGYSVATLAPSSQLWPEFISNKEHFSSRMPSDNR